MHKDQANGGDHRIANGDEELGFQNDPKRIHELFAKEVNVLEEPAIVTSLEGLGKLVHLF